MSTESEIRAVEVRIEKRRERLADVKRVEANNEAGSLEDFEKLGSVGQRRIFDADPGLFKQHFEALRERNMRKFLDGR